MPLSKDGGCDFRITELSKLLFVVHMSAGFNGRRIILAEIRLSLTSQYCWQSLFHSSHAILHTPFKFLPVATTHVAHVHKCTHYICAKQDTRLAKHTRSRPDRTHGVLLMDGGTAIVPLCLTHCRCGCVCVYVRVSVCTCVRMCICEQRICV